MTFFAYKIINDNNPCMTWVDLYVEYNEGYKKIKDYRNLVRNTSLLSEIEILGSIESDLQELNKILKNKTIYDFEAVNEEDLKKYNFTDVQKKVLKLRVKYFSWTKIANLLDLTPQAVFYNYKQAINKLIKYKKEEKVLSFQQEKILLLYKEGKKQADIAKELNISVNSVKTQLKRIRDKLKIKSLQELRCFHSEN